MNQSEDRFAWRDRTELIIIAKTINTFTALHRPVVLLTLHRTRVYRRPLQSTPELKRLLYVYTRYRDRGFLAFFNHVPPSPAQTSWKHLKCKKRCAQFSYTTRGNVTYAFSTDDSFSNLSHHLARSVLLPSIVCDVCAGDWEKNAQHSIYTVKERAYIRVVSYPPVCVYPST